MRERIIEFLKKENKTASQFAEEINVQPSGISHILSGRNKPSLDFIMKMMEKYPYISTDWLLFGKGEMYRDNSLATLFDNLNENVSKSKSDEATDSKTNSDKRIEHAADDDSDILHDQHLSIKTAGEAGKIIKIVFFYSDRTFEEYFPSGR